LKKIKFKQVISSKFFIGALTFYKGQIKILIAIQEIGKKASSF